MQKALEGVVLHKTDAEKEGISLAKEELVQGYPTFVLMDAEGATIDRWTGYGKEYFLERLREGIGDLTPIDGKARRFESKPTAPDALTLARYHETRGEYAEAVRFLDRAIVLDPERELSFMRLDYMASGFLRKDLFGAQDVAAAANAVLARDPSTDDLVGVVARMRAVSRKAEQPQMLLPYLEPALAVTKDTADEKLVRAHQELLIDRALLVERDQDRAVALKKELMPEGWEEDARQLNSFAWWCFENGLNFREAEALARKGAGLASPGEDRASILDTAAELCNARGDTAEAIALTRQAIAEAPDREYYPKQLARFEDIRNRRAEGN